MIFAGLIIGAVAAVSMMTIALFMIGMYAVMEKTMKELNGIRRCLNGIGFQMMKDEGDHHEAD